jgi:anti-sigma regulatory factor (Ser/Thr protein kinase)
MPDDSDPQISEISRFPANGSVKADESALKAVVDAAAAFGTTAIAREECRRRFLIVVEEIVTNIVRHGDASSGSEIGWRFTENGGTVRAYFEDSGVAFDPRDASPPPRTTQEPVEGGQGLPIIQAWCRIVDYRRTDGRNCLTLEMKPV